MEQNKLIIRAVLATDFPRWKPLWDGYNTFYGRANETALPNHITESSWSRFLDPDEPLFALVAEQQGRLLGLAHFLYHQHTIRIESVCYLQNLFTDELYRGRGVGRALIEAVYDHARQSGAKRVYWLTKENNDACSFLYDKVAENRGFIVYMHDL